MEYPALLREIKNPPGQLFIRGELPHPEMPCLAVVGSRKCTPYGLRMARELTGALARAGLVIVSGLAFGIDTAAHEAAVDAGGKTIAVLGSGVDIITPAENTPLAERILDHDGAIISQFTPGSHATEFTFPIRNLVISGMCVGTLVIEATDHSGALITAKAAGDQGRDVFAVPGPIDSESSRGTNDLLKDGAILVRSANDILDELGLSKAALERESAGPVKADTKEEAVILPLLGKQPVHIDQIIRAAQLPTSTISSSLTMMEIKGKVRHVGGNYYIIS